MSEPCRACDEFVKFIEFSQHFEECPNCGVWKNKRDLLDKHFQDTGVETENWLLTRADIEKFVPVLAQIETLSPIGTLLDVGCSYGYLLWLAKLRGWKAIGVDVKQSAQQAAVVKFRAKVMLGEFEDMDIDGEFDCIVFHHGIEHLRRPKKAIEKALEGIRKDGIIYMQHPVMQESDELARGHMDAGHQYEWTFLAFRDFLRQFPVKVVFNNEGEYRGGHVPPSQTWIISHE